MVKHKFSYFDHKMKQFLNYCLQLDLTFYWHDATNSNDFKFLNLAEVASNEIP